MLLLTPANVPTMLGVGTVTETVCNEEVVFTVNSIGSPPPQKTLKIISFPAGSEKFATPNEFIAAQIISSPLGPSDGVLNLNPALPFMQ